MSILELQQVSAGFFVGTRPIRVVDSVSFELEPGQTLGIVGESGSGKTVLTQTIMGLHDVNPSAWSRGIVRFDGEVISEYSQRMRRSLWGRRIATVPQNPHAALTPTKKVGRQITEVLCRRLGTNRHVAWSTAVRLLDEVGIAAPERRMKQYPHQLSGGMRQRVLIAIALAGEPDLLIADEPTTALDVTVQAQILALLSRVQAERKMSMILVTHDLALVSGLADLVAVMYFGRVVEFGESRSLLESPRMPYTSALLRSSPRLDSPPGTLPVAIPGVPPDVSTLGVGCAFEPRCPVRLAQCKVERPGPTEVDGSSHTYACWNSGGVDGR